MTTSLTGKIWCGTDLLKVKNNHIADALSQVSALVPQPADQDTFEAIAAHHITPEVQVGSHTSQSGAEPVEAPSIPKMAWNKEKCSRKQSSILNVWGWASSGGQLNF